MSEGTVYKDERTTTVENASYRWAVTVLSYGLLLDATYRSWIRHEAAWDLLGLVILAGLVSFFYQYPENPEPALDDVGSCDHADGRRGGDRIVACTVSLSNYRILTTSYETH